MATTPLYKKVKDQIIKLLAKNVWRPGEMLPTERQLAERFEVGISTIRAAIGELVAAHILVRSQGKGTYVASHGSADDRYRFFNLFDSGGHKASFIREVVKIRKEEGSTEVTAALALPPNASVFRLTMHIYARRTPIALSHLTVPASLFPDLDRKMEMEGDTSLYAIFQSAYGINVIRLQEKLTAVKAPPAVRKALELPAGEPVLRIDRTAYTFNGSAVEVRSTWIHTSHHHYLVDRGEERR